MEDRCREIERSIIKQYRKEIWRPFVRALNDYDMIQPGDNIAVCISGGKDSMLLAKCMQEILRHGKMEFGLHFIVMDPGYHPENRKMIEENARVMGIPVQIFDSDIFDIVVDVDESPCYLCARMRRGYLYAKAKELGCNKIALGHHFDDVIETILMSMLYGAQVNTMMPKLHSTNFEGMELIRPLYLVKEEHILAWKDHNQLKFLQCACRFTEQIARELAEREGSQNLRLPETESPSHPGQPEAAGSAQFGLVEVGSHSHLSLVEGETPLHVHSADIVHTSKRQEMKELIRQLRQVSSHIEMNIFRSVENVNIDACIGYVKDGKRHHFLEEY